ncbi:MAG: hypothetical protein PGN13_04410 [Patulibacter minatonensis]
MLDGLLIAVLTPLAVWSWLILLLPWIGRARTRGGRPIAAPVDAVDEPLRFRLPDPRLERVSAHRPRKVHRTDLFLSALPWGLTGRRSRRVVLEHGVVTTFAYASMFVLDPGRGEYRLTVLLIAVVATWASFQPRPAGIVRREWVDWYAAVLASVERADRPEHRCPRCRLRARTASGWCRPCEHVLAAHALAHDDPRGRVGAWSARRADPSLLEHCGAEVATSFRGTGTVITPAWVAPDRNPLAAIAGTDDRHVARDGVEAVASDEIEVAYADPDRPELIWVRLTERFAIRGAGDGLLTWRRVEAHGFSDGRLVQRFVFGPLDVPAAPVLVAEPSTTAAA